ncbi:MAG: hypothetical protein KJN93_07020 [Alphaproteobacteria bacterium]|nr:hypothetical protein [Alphaproteobacteria bacterium]NNF23877.1 hypothetical protein [Paracoccaceae bacterium]
MKPLIVLTILALAACTNPTANANIGLGAGGVSVTPSVSGNVGGLGVTVRG